MEIDATAVTSGETISTDFCIIGAGPAGLVVAAELCRQGRAVVVLESGGWTPSASEQELNDGSCTGDPYSGLRLTRHRGVGGSTNLWNTATRSGSGAKYVALDPWDFEGRWPASPDGWPISFDELQPWVERARAICGIGNFNLDGDVLAAELRRRLHNSNTTVTPRSYQLGAREALIGPLLASLRNASKLRLFVHATVTAMAEKNGHATIRVCTSHQGSWSVRADRVVLAGGAVENARLLLASAAQLPRGVNSSGWLGRGFMEHPRDRAITLTPTNDAQFAALAFFDARATPSASGQSTTLGRLALTRQVIESDSLLNASATLLPNVQPTRERIREVMKRRTGVQGFRRWLPEGGHGWSEHPARARVFSGFTVLLNVEQPSRPENAVTLSDRCDRFGVPLPELRWQWHADDQANLERVRAVFASAIEGAGFGKVSVAAGNRPDPNAHHHAGTTRMHADARHGVVDANGQVFGTHVIHVAGASTFPSAGFANPTLTIVAMALRLAEHLVREQESAAR